MPAPPPRPIALARLLAPALALGLAAGAAAPGVPAAELAELAGRGGEALAEARRAAARVPYDAHEGDWIRHQVDLSRPLYAMVRSGMWDAIRAEPEPPESAVLWHGVWDYARGLAHARNGELRQARRHAASLRARLEDPRTARDLSGIGAGDRDAAALLEIAGDRLAAEIASAAGVRASSGSRRR